MRKPKFIGVYSQSQGATGKGKTLYFVWQLPDASLAIQELDKALQPRGRPKRISLNLLKASFRSEPTILAAPVSTPDISEISPQASGRGGEARELTDDVLAELEKARKATQVENDLRMNFDRALRALNRPRDRRGAMAAIEQIAETKKGIVPAHKHMFRDFGVSLRKKSLPELALICTRRVLELAPNDDHAHFNMARILTILGLYDEATAHVKAAKKLDSSLQVYDRMADFIRQERRIDPDRRKNKNK